MKYWKMNRRPEGFTIVELLIVVVIIAILAAITIAAYNGMQNRAKSSAAQSTATTLSKKLQAYHMLAGSYPASVASVNSSLNNHSESSISTGANINYGTPSAANGTNTVRLEVCGPTSGGPYGQGMRITGWDYTTKAISTKPILLGTTSFCSTT